MDAPQADPPVGAAAAPAGSDGAGSDAVDALAGSNAAGAPVGSDAAGDPADPDAAGDPADSDAAGPPANPDAVGDDGVAIRVARSGGIAGMTRRWSVQPSGGETEHWMILVERCPWDEKPPASTGADRYLWRIEVRIRRECHEQVIPEEHLLGPWRALVDAVRQADPGTAPG